jgi:hypothetical protein
MRFGKLSFSKYIQIIFLIITFFVFTSVSSNSFANNNSGISYQGRILNPAGTAMTSSAVQFKFQIRTPDTANCLMYEEIQVIDMSQTDGAFAITINDGTGTRTDSTGYGIDTIFANKGSFSFSSGCATGNSYAPNPTDGRRLQVYFKSTEMNDWEPMPTQNLNFIPQAIESQQIGGYKPGDLLRVDKTPSQTVAAFTYTDYTNLVALLAGTSTQYLSTSTTQGAELPTYASNPGTPSSGSLWYDSTLKQVKYFDGTSIKVFGTSGGSVTAIVTGTGLTGGPITASGTISIANGGVDTPQIASSAITDPKIASGTITGDKFDPAITVSTSGNITASQVSTTSTSARSLLLYDPDAPGINKITISANAAIAADYAITFPATGPSLGQYLTSDALGNLSWTNSSAAPTSFMSGSAAAPGWAVTGNTNTGLYSPASNTLSIAAGGVEGLRVNTAGGAVDYIAVTPGGVSTTQISTAGTDANVDLKISPKGAGNTIIANGNVGIGTTSPNGLLDVEGGTAAAGGGASITLQAQAGAAGGNSGGDINLYPGGTTNWGHPAMVNVLGGGHPGSSASTINLHGSGNGYISGAVNGRLLLGENLFEDYNFATRVMLNNVYAAIDLNNGGISFDVGPSSGSYTAVTPTTAMFISNAANVGVGTASPTAKMHIGAGVSTASGAPLKFTAGSNLATPEAGAVEFDGNYLYITNASGARSTIFTSASLAPTSFLSGSAAAPGWSVTGNTNTGLFSAASNTLSIAAGGIEGLRVNTSGGATDYIAVTPGGVSSTQISTAGTDTNVDLKIAPKGVGNTIIANGNVGIGSAAPTTKLDVNGGISMSGTLTNGNSVNGISLDSTGRTTVSGGSFGVIETLSVSNTSSANGSQTEFNFMHGAVPTASILETQVSPGFNSLAFLTKSTTVAERMRIDSTGYVGIGTTAPLSILEVQGGAITAGPTSASAAGGGEIRMRGLAANGSQYVAFRSPDVVAASTTWTLPSADGASGAMLSTNGAGILSWATAAAAPTSFLSGSAAAPGWSVTGNTNTGLFSAASNTLSIAAGGIEGLRVNTSGGATDYIAVTPGGVSSTTLGTSGSDANVDLKIAPKGTGNTVIANGNVGIGTTTPTGILDVEGGTSTTGSGTSITLAAQNALAAGGQGGDIYLNPGARASFNRNGFVQLGTNLTSGTIALGPAGSGYQSSYASRILSAQNIVLDYNGALRTVAGGNISYSGIDQSGGAISFYTAASGSVNWSTVAPTTRMVVDTVGNVGIGTTGPLSLLHVSQDVTGAPISLKIDNPHSAASGGIGSYLEFAASGNQTQARIGSVWSSTNSNNANLLFFVKSAGSNSEAMRMDSNLNVGIGTTAPASRLEVQGGAFTAGPTSASAAGGGEIRMRGLAANGSQYVAFRAPDVVAASTTWTLPSADGASGTALTTNGSGVLSWVNAITGGSTGLFANGSVSAPSVSFTSATSSGMYRPASGVVGFTSGGVDSMRLNYVASAVNYASISPSVSSGAVVYGVAGSDTNVDLKLSPKGTGNTVVGNGNLYSSSGQIYSSAQSSAAATPLTFDTNSGNTMVWTNNTAALTANVYNMRAGGTYMLVVAGTGTGTVTINCYNDAGVTSLPSSFAPANGGRVAGTLNKSVYTLISDGTNCLVSWITAF